MQGLAEGTAYRYQVVAVNGRGESEPSATVTFTTKQALYKYDMQLAGNPLMPGYTEVTARLGYTRSAASASSNTLAAARVATAARPRGRTTSCATSCSPVTALDVRPRRAQRHVLGEDVLGRLDRLDAHELPRSRAGGGTGNAGRAAVNETLRGPFLVTDGQLNVEAYGAAAARASTASRSRRSCSGPWASRSSTSNADPAAPSVRWRGMPSPA